MTFTQCWTHRQQPVSNEFSRLRAKGFAAELAASSTKVVQSRSFKQRPFQTAETMVDVVKARLAWNVRVLFMGMLLVLLSVLGTPSHAAKQCLTDCTQRIGIVSAFGAEADLLRSKTERRRDHVINGNRFTTGVLEGNSVVIVLSGVSVVNASMVTQLMLDHFHIERLIMSGIAGGLDPKLHVGDVTIPERWAMTSETFWSSSHKVPDMCGVAGDLACLGLKLARRASGELLQPVPLPSTDATAKSGMFLRETEIVTRSSIGKETQFRFFYPVDAEMLAVARQLRPALQRCSGDPKVCVETQPQLRVSGTGLTGSYFLSNAAIRDFFHTELGGVSFDMETAALAHVATANQTPFIAFRSLSDLAGAHESSADAAALFTSGLAEKNAASVALDFLKHWKARKQAK